MPSRTYVLPRNKASALNTGDPAPPALPRRRSSSGHRSARTQLNKTLRETFGIHHLRPGQQEVMESVLQGHDTLAIMPTGAGKSLCYQLPALDIPGTTVVVSPLISLMKDQVDKLAEAGLDATEINSTLKTQEHADAIEDIQAERNEFIFTTPEQLMNEDFVATIKQNPVGLFVIDEAHCISQWGHDFRPAFLQLSAVIAALGHPTVLALTATAPDQVVQDIIGQLQLPDMRVINTGIYRPNLSYHVIQVTSEDEKKDQALQLVRDNAGSGIIYAATIKAVELLHQALIEAGEDAVFYHGQLSAKEREHNQDAFMNGEHRIMVATNAFGMGIDKPDIRFILHYQMPANLQAYYQESGRAGRDQLAAKCILLFHEKDKQVQNFFLSRRYPGTDDVNTAYQSVQAISTEGKAVYFADIARACEGMPENRLQVALKLLQDGKLLRRDRHLAYHLRATSATASELEHLAESYRHKSQHDREALERLVFYAQTGFCRWKVLLEYFDEQVDWTHCGHCDNCIHPPELALAPVAPLHEAPEVKTADQQAIPDLRLGSEASVPKYGQGRITAVAGDKVTMVFPDSQSRTFLRQYITQIK